MAYVFISNTWGTVCDHCLKIGGFADPDYCWYNHYAWYYRPYNWMGHDSYVAYIPGGGVEEDRYDEACAVLDMVTQGARV